MPKLNIVVPIRAKNNEITATCFTNLFDRSLAFTSATMKKKQAL